MSDTNYIMAIILSGLISQALFVKALRKLEEKKTLSFNNLKEGARKLRRVNRIELILTIFVIIICLGLSEWLDLHPLILGLLFGGLSSFIHFLFPYQAESKKNKK